MIKLLFYCWRGKHLDQSFIAYPLSSGNLRVTRCQHCDKLLDVQFLCTEGATSVHLRYAKRLETVLSTVPGYPQERFR